MDEKTQTVSVEDAKTYLRANKHDIFNSKTADLIENEAFIEVTQFVHGRDSAKTFLLLFSGQIWRLKVLDKSDPEKRVELMRKLNGCDRQRKEQLEAAKDHLEQAALLLGLRKDFYYSSSKIEGETPDELHARAWMLQDKSGRLHSKSQRTKRAAYDEYLKYQKERGCGKNADTALNGIAARYLWEEIPEDMPNPYSTVAKLLQYAGFNVNRQKVKRFISPKTPIVTIEESRQEEQVAKIRKGNGWPVPKQWRHKTSVIVSGTSFITFLRNTRQLPVIINQPMRGNVNVSTKLFNRNAVCPKAPGVSRRRVALQDFQC